MKHRIDANQTEIVSCIRQIGATVQDLSTVGGGCPDIIVGYKKVNYFFEIKTKQGKLNKRQIKWHDHWQGQVHVIRDEMEAFEIMRVDLSSYEGI